MKQPKITLVGAGQIGGILALLSGLKGLGNVTLIDIAEDTAKGKALDISHTGAVEKCSRTFAGTRDYAALAGADVVIVTAGVARKPGMSRDELLDTNCAVTSKIAQEIKTHASNAFVIMITNPLDAMVWVMQKVSGLPHHKVVGMAGVLDSARFKCFLSEALNVAVEDIQAMVLGGHGDAMVPLVDYTTIAGVPLKVFIERGLISQKKVDAIIHRTRHGGAEIVQLLKNSSAYFAPAASAIEMAKAYLHDQKRLLPCAAYCAGAFGIQDLYVGVPVIIGTNGVEQIIDLPLSHEEELAFKKSVDSVESLTKNAARRLS